MQEFVSAETPFFETNINNNFMRSQKKAIASPEKHRESSSFWLEVHFQL